MNTEVYPQAPVSYVRFLAQFPLVPALERRETKDAIYETLKDSFPLLEHIGGMSFQIAISGPGAGEPTTQPAAPEKARLMNRERTRSITIGPRMIALEQTEHISYEHLRGQLEQILTALTDAAPPSAMSAITLQYIDEIRHPDTSGPADWDGLLADSLLGPATLASLRAQQTSGIAVYQLTDHHELRLGYGAAPEGFVVDPGGPLRVAHPQNGPFFRLDLEGEWRAPEQEIPPFAVPEALSAADVLHDAIRDAFEGAITPVLREHFRKDPDGDGQS